MSCCFRTKSDCPLYVILPYFNFCGFKRRRDLFIQFVERYAKTPGLRLVVVEAMGPEPLGRLPVHEHIRLTSDSRVWLKENLINLGVKALPKDWKYLAWIDADLEFLNQNWVQETIRGLQRADVVQLWRTAVNLGPHGEAIKVDKSFAYMFVGSGTDWTATDKYGFWHPGYAWACTRAAFQKMGGLPDWAILGSGDRHLAMSLAGLGQTSCPGTIHENYKIMLKLYEKSLKNFKVSWVDGTIIHYWHGSFTDRKYRERWDILVQNSFDPFEDIGYTDEGLVQLTEKGQRFEKYLDDYFMGRREDS
jgi:hypothetical protein